MACDVARDTRRRTGRDAIVNDHRDPTVQIEALTAAPEPGDPVLELPSFVSLDGLPLIRGDLSPSDQVTVYDLEPTLADRAHRQLGLERQSELSHDDDVEGSLEYTGDLERHRNPTPRQPEDDNVLATQVLEAPGKLTPGIDPVTETAHRPLSLPSHSGSVSQRRPRQGR
jgi:hypothetical protein